MQKEKEDLVKDNFFQIKKLVLATNNRNKIVEIQDILKNLAISVEEAGNNFNPEENGKTFEENAFIKAYAAAKLKNIPALADDSGLEVDALDGKPGIYSSRYGENDEKRINRVLKELQSIPPEKRTASFVCSMVIVSSKAEIIYSCTASVKGYITDKPRGNNGFGYDPIFFIPELNKTMAELSFEEKNSISHRSKALNCIIDFLSA